LGQSIYTNFIVTQLCKTGLTEEAAFKLSGQVRVRSFEEDAVMCFRGEKVRNWCYVINGAVGASITNMKDEKSLVQVYSSGSWFGEQSIVNNKPSFFDYLCLSDVDLLMVPEEEFRLILDTNPRFVRNLCHLLAWRDQFKSEMIAVLKNGAPQHKITLSLAYLVEALCFNSNAPMGSKLSSTVFVQGKQNLFASFCGVSRPVFSAYVQKLMAKGFLKVHYGKIEFFKLDAWIKLAHEIRHNDHSLQDFLNGTAIDDLDMKQSHETAKTEDYVNQFGVKTLESSFVII